MRILIADDHDLVRDTIAAFLEGEGMGEIVTCENLADALAAVQGGGAFDLVLLDYNMDGMDGLAGLEKMRAANGDQPVAIISGTASATIANDAIEAGAAGFVPKTMGARSMLAAIRFMIAGEVYVPYEFLKSAEESQTVGNLTVRETEVLRGLCDGKSNKEIARDLELQEVTIKLHVKNLCRKLDAKNRTQAAMIARDRKLI
jgi:DNA-binding NarL/FixJ family response regulator